MADGTLLNNGKAKVPSEKGAKGFVPQSDLAQQEEGDFGEAPISEARRAELDSVKKSAPNDGSGEETDGPSRDE